jgi:hypothetical protein
LLQRVLAEGGFDAACRGKNFPESQPVALQLLFPKIGNLEIAGG